MFFEPTSIPTDHLMIVAIDLNFKIFINSQPSTPSLITDTELNRQDLFVGTVLALKVTLPRSSL